MPKTIVQFERHVSSILEDAENSLTFIARTTLLELYQEHHRLSQKIQQAELDLKKIAQSHPVAVQLMQLRGIGTITSLALYACVGTGKQFKNTRQLSAWLGLAPKQHGTGDITRLGQVAKYALQALDNKALLHDPAERQHRINQKRQLLLSWLVDFTWTTPGISGEVMGLHSRSATNKTLHQLEQQVVIRSSAIQFLQGRDVTIYGITPEGLLWLDYEDNTHFGKPTFDPGKVSISTFQHRLDVQKCRLCVRDIEGFQWIAENNLPKEIMCRPDAIVKSSSRIIALELERTAKTRKRYQQIIVQHLHQISQGHYEQVHYVSTIDGFARRLKRLFYSIQKVSFKGQQISFNDELKKHFKFYSLENWRL